MSKGKAKIDSSEGVALPEFRSLRSRKRKCPSNELSLTQEIQLTLLTSRECATIRNQQDQAAELSYLTKQDFSTEKKHAEENVKAAEQQEPTTVIHPKNYFQLQRCAINPENYTNKTGNEEITPQDINSPPCQTHTDQYQLLTSDIGRGSFEADMEEQLGANPNSHCNLERNAKTSQEESTTFMDDVREVTKDLAAGPPTEKKRRMGMSGLTEKERSPFLQTQKREIGQDEAEIAKLEICSVTEQSEAEMKLQSSHCEADNRTGTEVSVTVAIQNGTTTLCYPICSGGKSWEAERSTEIGLEKTDEPKSDPPAEGKVEEQLGNLEHQEFKGSSAEIMNRDAESPKDDSDGALDVNCCPFNPFPINPSQNKLAENKKDASQSSPLQVHSVIRARVERKEKMVSDAGNKDEAGVYSADTRPVGLCCGSVELCEAAVTDCDHERKNSCEPGFELAAGSSAVNTEHTQTRVTTDPFGSGNSDYVSDSQMNSVVMIEEEVMKKEEEDCSSSHCHEDATDRIRGLIRELSSLNRKVMATHRELVNLRRGSKTSRSSKRILPP
ncbi:hypothetical protein EXN66_Car003009 [Channa argus]|uniref:Uncharacterized protein n=1 Tax=Channa argus TaxID=215402 RepID=A0A6G1PAR4_CHAAH|nr:hypothetical protein EXN66_Car003009 [Channa argus]